MSSFAGLYNIRKATESDQSFILATWLRGLYYGDSWFSAIPKDIFMNHYKQIARAMLVSPKINVRVACLKEDQDVILGYSICSSDDKALVWCFTKTAWRQQGIAKSLIPERPEYATLLTAVGRTLLKEKLPNTKFNPFYL